MRLERRYLLFYRGAKEKARHVGRPCNVTLSNFHHDDKVDLIRFSCLENERNESPWNIKSALKFKDARCMKKGLGNITP